MKITGPVPNTYHIVISVFSALRWTDGAKLLWHQELLHEGSCGIHLLKDTVLAVG